VTFVFTLASLTGQHGAAQAGITLLALILLTGLTGGPFYLATRLARPGRPWARVAAIGLESLMTVLGVAMCGLAIIAGGPAVFISIFGLIGAGLSGGAACWMLGADARRYCSGRFRR
jgi:hypothetical protein